MHAWWHIEPTETIKYWKDKAAKFGGAYAGEVEKRMQPGWKPPPSVQKDINRFIGSQAKGLGGAIQRGALAAQEGVVDPLLDRLVGTAPGIPPRPFFGGETGVPPEQLSIPSTVAPKSMSMFPPSEWPGGESDIGAAHRRLRDLTPASLGFTMPPSTQVTGPPAVPAPAVPTRLPAAVEAQFQALQSRPQMATTVAPPAARSLPAYPDPGIAGHTPPRVQAEAVTPERFRPQPRRTAREEAMHGRLTPPSIMQRPGVKEFLGEDEDDELGGMLKMMFMSDLIRGSAADTPSYPRAVSVGPASRDFARLPSMRWR